MLVIQMSLGFFLHEKVYSNLISHIISIRKHSNCHPSSQHLTPAFLFFSQNSHVFPGVKTDGHLHLRYAVARLGIGSLSSFRILSSEWMAWHFFLFFLTADSLDKLSAQFSSAQLTQQPKRLKWASYLSICQWLLHGATQPC